ncbi:MAG: sigma-70 family RNA polymerase sigma factor [Sphingobacteriales bacterium]|nr:sigma-70 family RNA polymerase sigma factor [Sphingobacteriales bacterium]
MTVLGELYQRYMELVYGVCLKYFKEPERAKDSVMAIFEELVLKLKKHEVENFRAWLHQLAKNHCLMQLRTPKNMKTVEFRGELMQSEENMHLNGVLEKEENFRKLEDCLAILAGEQQESIRLFYLEGKSYNEIVDLTGMEWNQVRSLIQNGRRNLKICMDKAQKEAAGDQQD